MDATQFKAAVTGMPDADLREVIGALDRARDQATQLKISARLPECAAFGAIARDLDYSLGLIRSAVENPVTVDVHAGEALAAPMADFATSGGRETIGGP